MGRSAYKYRLNYKVIWMPTKLKRLKKKHKKNKIRRKKIRRNGKVGKEKLLKN